MNEIEKFAEQFKLMPTRKIMDNAIDLTHTPDNYDGSFRAIYEAVKNDIIKPLVVRDRIVGISYNANCDNIEADNIEAYAFEQAYRHKPVESYIMTSFNLVTAGMVPDLIEEDGNMVLIYLVNQRCVLNGYGDVFVEVNGGDCVYREDMLDLLKKQVRYRKEGQCRANDHAESGLPEEVRIPADEIDRTYDGIKKFLRNEYGHYLAKGHEFTVDYDEEEDLYIVSDIKWGRKM